MPSRLALGIEEIHRHWFWYFGLGVLLLILGGVALTYNFTATFVSVLFFGWMLIGSGFGQALVAVGVQTWSGFFLHLLGGILEMVVGLLVISAPVDVALLFTMLIAAYLLIGGLFRLIVSVAVRFPGALWMAVGGLVSFLLGLFLWMQWPVSALWFLGTCVGVDLILHGLGWIAFALGARRFGAAPAAT